MRCSKVGFPVPLYRGVRPPPDRLDGGEPGVPHAPAQANATLARGKRGFPFPSARGQASFRPVGRWGTRGSPRPRSGERDARQRQAGFPVPPYRGGGSRAAPCPCYTPNNERINAFCTCRRFSACSKTSDCGPSITSAVTSSPRWAGRQCINTARGAARAIRAGFTW